MKMTTDDLELIPLDELWDLHVKIAILLARKLAAEKRQLEKRLQELQQSRTSNQDTRRERRPYPQVFPKYRNPAKPSETWAGRGKQPRWLKAELKSGRKVEDFRIGTTKDRAARRSVSRR
jgi:DNA-binding protein H-NS